MTRLLVILVAIALWLGELWRRSCCQLCGTRSPFVTIRTDGFRLCRVCRVEAFDEEVA